MLGDLQKELVRIRREVSAVMEAAKPALRMRDKMIMDTVWLGVIEMKLRAEQDPEKRKEWINAFWARRNEIERTISGYRRRLESRTLHPQQKPRRAVS